MNKHPVRLGTDYTGETLRRRDGHVVAYKRVIATCTYDECARPEKKFECVITTKPPFYCPECQIAVKHKKSRAYAEKHKAKLKETGAGPPVKRRRLIRYAGYDKGE